MIQSKELCLIKRKSKISKPKLKPLFQVVIAALVLFLVDLLIELAFHFPFLPLQDHYYYTLLRDHRLPIVHHLLSYFKLNLFYIFCSFSDIQQKINVNIPHFYQTSFQKYILWVGKNSEMKADCSTKVIFYNP